MRIIYFHCFLDCPFKTLDTNINTKYFLTITLYIILPLFHFTTELGSGPFSLVSAVSNDTMFGVNRTSRSVFPLVRERPGQLPATDVLFNFMVTTGLQKDQTSSEHPQLHDYIFCSLFLWAYWSMFPFILRGSCGVTGICRKTELFPCCVRERSSSDGALGSRSRV